MWGYRKRLETDLVRWRDAGWITPVGEAAILADVARGGRSLGLANALAILAAVLMGFAVMSFVGANWQDMPRIARIVLLLTALAGSYGLAGFLDRRGMPGFAEAAILLAVAIFGGSIMLISQMYHMDGNVADFLLTWAGAAILSGALLRSNASLALAMILACYWGISEALDRDVVFWPFLIPWAIISGLFYLHRWRPGVHISGLALTGFVVSMGYFLREHHGYWIVTGIGLALGLLAIAGEKLKPELPRLWSGSLAYAIYITFSGLFALQFINEPDLGRFIILAIVALAICIAAIYWGVLSGNRGALWLGYLGFSFEILAVYGKTVGTLLNTSLFFLVAAVIVAVLAAMAYRLHSEGDKAKLEGATA